MIIPKLSPFLLAGFSWQINSIWASAQELYGPSLITPTSISTPATCPARTVTTSYVTTIVTTITSVTEVPHSCYTYSVTSLQSDNGMYNKISFWSFENLSQSFHSLVYLIPCYHSSPAMIS